jgi:hypothetical protein
MFKFKTTIAIFIILLFFGCTTIQSNINNNTNAGNNGGVSTTLSSPKQKCGDGFCAADEYCNTCPQDCGCTGNLICDMSSGICKLNITTPNCTSNQYFNEETKSCVDKPKFNETLINQTIQVFGKQNNASLEIISIADSYYHLNPVKEVVVKDTATKNEFILEIGSDYKILEIYTK